MKGQLIFAIFMMIVVVLAGILAGTSIQNIIVEKTSSGIAWTGFVISVSLGIMTAAMSSHIMLDPRITITKKVK